MTPFPTLPTAPLEHVSMDYARLREEALLQLARLASAQWTDYNVHDPGITILEQLCYAITDLGYRIAFPMPELLAGSSSWLPGPETILTTDPVTPMDLRRVALDVEDIGNAWVEEPADPEVPFYYHAPSGELRLRADPAEPDAVPVRLRGISRIILQTPTAIRGNSMRSVAERLHAGRGLGSDFQLSLLGTFPVGIQANIEIGATDEPAVAMVEIIERIEAYLSPPVRFITRTEAFAQGRAIDEIFDGPLLDGGFVELLPEPRRTIYVSDLVHAILDVPVVKAVRSLVLERAPGQFERWALDIPAGQVAVLASLELAEPSQPAQLPATRLTLVRGDLQLRVDPETVSERLEARRGKPARAPAGSSEAGAVAPRQRDPTRHQSIQYLLPAAYGVGPLGLPTSSTPERRAQARQLAAYLLIFDQLFANSLAQLAHARELLSPEERPVQSYFALPVEGPQLNLKELLQEPDDHRAWLDKNVEPGDPVERHRRFLAHLLARFGEELGEHSMISGASSPADGKQGTDGLVADRCAFLRDHLRLLSRTRGSGYNIISPAPSGFEERLRHKLGMRNGQTLYVVEHILLRPLVEDLAQLTEEGEPEMPLLAGVETPDPWSLNVSVVLEERAEADSSFDQFVEQTILAESPAHLSVRLHWFGKTNGVDDREVFTKAWGAFRTAYRDYRWHQLQPLPVSVDLQLGVRDARDRVIDLLGIGRTYPLRDVPVPDNIFVASGLTATIPLSFSQEGVIYRLCDAASGSPVVEPGSGKTYTVKGNGGPVDLETPPITKDERYRIKAEKQTNPTRETWLRTVVSVKEGVDQQLEATILDLPPLDPGVEPKLSSPRLGDYGVQAEIQVLDSQEGVIYDAVEDAADLSTPTVVSEHPAGTTPPDDVVLRTQPVHEDVDLRIRGKKMVSDPRDPTLLLQTALPLRVRANPDATVALSSQVVEYAATAELKVKTTQVSTEYTLYRGRVRDRDYLFDAQPDVTTIDVPVDDRIVRLRRPPRPAIWADLEGFEQVGEAVRGNGGSLQWSVDVPPGTSGAFLVLKASKQHQAGPLREKSKPIESALQLASACALLTQPNPVQPLRLAVTMRDGATTGALLVEGGEPGVFYEFRRGGEDQPIARPAYFHQRDDENDHLNKGIEQIRLGVDFVVSRDGAIAAPLLDIPPLPEGTVLHVLARRAMSGLQASLDRVAVIAAVPAVSAEPAAVSEGSAAGIVIEASRTDERYQLVRGGKQIADVRGNGGRLVLSTGPLDATMVFTVVMTRLDEASLAVERSVEIKVDIM